MEKKHDVSKCLDKIRKGIITEDSLVKSVYFDLSNICDVTKKPTAPKRTGQRITYKYEHTKRDGTKTIKQATSFVSHDYCPYCGIKF